MIKLKLTSIQLYEETKKKLERKKTNPRESYDSVVNRILEDGEIPSMEEMVKKGARIKQKRRYSTREIVKLSHELWEKR